MPEAILQLQRLAFQSEANLYQDWEIPPLKESVEELVAEFDQKTILKAFYDNSNRVIGSVRAQFQNGTCSIGRLIVHPQFQRRGVGSELMSQIESHFPEAHRFELFTGHRSNHNRLFYGHLGYVPFREQRLSDHVTHIFLQKIVPNK